MINKTRAYVNRRPETFSTMAFTITGFCARASSVRFVCQIYKSNNFYGEILCRIIDPNVHARNT